MQKPLTFIHPKTKNTYCTSKYRTSTIYFGGQMYKLCTYTKTHLGTPIKMMRYFPLGPKKWSLRDEYRKPYKGKLNS